MSWIGHGIDANFEDDRVSWIGGVVMMLIPWFHPNIFMEGSTALELSEAVKLVFQSEKSTHFIFMRIKDDRSVDFINEQQLLKFGDWWIVGKDATIIGIYETVNEVKAALNGLEFTVGWCESGLCVTAATKAFIHDIRSGSSDEYQLLLDTFHGIEVII